MPKASPLQSDFSGGEFNPLYYGRVDNERYKTGLATCKNMVPIIQGPLTRRPGTFYAGAAAGNALLIPFQFSNAQAYILEFSNGLIRFWQNYQLVMSGGVPYTVSTPYSTADLSAIRWTQNADVLYLVHTNHPPQTLTRFGATSWALANPFTQPVGSSLIANRAPYLDTVALAYGPSNGAVYTFSMTSLVLTSTGGITGPFASTDVGRTIALNITASGWCLYEITGFTNTNVVTLTQCFDALFTTATTSVSSSGVTEFALGVWSDTTGWPGCVTFHEDRLVFSGTTNYPQRVDGSRTSDYLNFTPFNPDGSVPDSAAYSFTMNSTTLDLIEWLVSDEQALLAGSSSGEWQIRPSVQGDALSPTNVNAKKTTYWGSSPTVAIKAGKSTIHVQRAGKRVRELMYRFEYNGFISTELSELSAHMTSFTINPSIKPGIVALAYQQNPYSVIWAIRSDGQLIGCTYDHDGQSLHSGWHQHTLGGNGGTPNAPPFIQSIAVIPSPDGTRDDLWMAVARTINGSQLVTIEYMGKFFEQTDEQQNAHHVDCGLLFSAPQSVASITAANPAVATVGSHGYSNGDQVIFLDVLGMTQVNGLTFTVAGVTTNTFELSGFNSTAMLPGSAGTVNKKLTTFAAAALEGETLQILADGGVAPDVVVGASSSNNIVLSAPAACVHAGYTYNSDIQMLPIEAGSANGTALGKTRRTQRVGLYLYRTLGLLFGFNFNALDSYVFDTSDEPAGAAPGLYTGIISENTDSDYDFYNQFCMRFSTPLPATVLAVAPQMEEQDRG